MDFKNLLFQSLNQLNTVEFDFFKKVLRLIVPTDKITDSFINLTKPMLTHLLWVKLEGASFCYVLSALKTSGFISQYNSLDTNLADALFCFE